jgi:hypothetical protein
MASQTDLQPVQQKSRSPPSTTAHSRAASDTGRPQWKQRIPASGGARGEVSAVADSRTVIKSGRWPNNGATVQDAQQTRRFQQSKGATNPQRKRVVAPLFQTHPDQVPGRQGKDI